MTGAIALNGFICYSQLTPMHDVQYTMVIRVKVRCCRKNVTYVMPSYEVVKIFVRFMYIYHDVNTQTTENSNLKRFKLKSISFFFQLFELLHRVNFFLILTDHRALECQTIGRHPPSFVLNYSDHLGVSGCPLTWDFGVSSHRALTL